MLKRIIILLGVLVLLGCEQVVVDESVKEAHEFDSSTVVGDFT